MTWRRHNKPPDVATFERLQAIDQERKVRRDDVTLIDAFAEVAQRTTRKFSRCRFCDSALSVR